MNNTSPVVEKSNDYYGANIFVIKTFEMISTCPEHLAKWSDNGDTFVVFDKVKLAEKVIPQFFGHSKFESLSRQLNFYGWKKVPQQHSKSKHIEFYHENFKRGRKDLLSLIVRRNGKGGKNKSDANDHHQAEEIKTLKRKVSELEETVKRFQDKMTHFEMKLSAGYAIPPQCFSSNEVINYNQSTVGSSSASVVSNSTLNSANGTPQTRETRSTMGKSGGGCSEDTPASLAPCVSMKEASSVITVPIPPDESQLRPGMLLRGFSSKSGFSGELYDAGTMELIMTDKPKPPPVRSTSANLTSISDGKELLLPPIGLDVGTTEENI